MGSGNQWYDAVSFSFRVEMRSGHSTVLSGRVLVRDKAIVAIVPTDSFQSIVLFDLGSDSFKL